MTENPRLECRAWQAKRTVLEICKMTPLKSGLCGPWQVLKASIACTCRQMKLCASNPRTVLAKAVSQLGVPENKHHPTCTLELNKGATEEQMPRVSSLLKWERGQEAKDERVGQTVTEDITLSSCLYRHRWLPTETSVTHTHVYTLISTCMFVFCQESLRSKGF